MGLLLTDRDVAERLGKHPRTIQRMCADGRFAGATKQGRTWRIPEADLDRVAGRGISADRGVILTAAATCRRIRTELADASGPMSEYAESELNRVAEALHQLQVEVADLAACARDTARTGGRQREMRRSRSRPSG
ncbi:MAG: helix-turn-helix domain-containing protein [Solirubrobacteraceae bacterium]